MHGSVTSPSRKEKKMTLYEYLENTNDWETTVWDKDYDMETYFYKEDSTVWDKAMREIAKKLTIVSFSKEGVTVNLSEVLTNSLEKLEESDLFHFYDIEAIMYDIGSILAGNVSEEWLADFADALNR